MSYKLIFPKKHNGSFEALLISSTGGHSVVSVTKEAVGEQIIYTVDTEVKAEKPQKSRLGGKLVIPTIEFEQQLAEAFKGTPRKQLETEISQWMSKGQAARVIRRVEEGIFTKYRYNEDVLTALKEWLAA